MSDPPAGGPPTLDIAAIVETLNRHGVAYVVIGGFSSQAWATSLGVNIQPTMDIDVTPDTDQANLQRLSDALRELGARIRSEADPEGLLFDHDGASLGPSHDLEPDLPGRAVRLVVHAIGHRRLRRPGPERPRRDGRGDRDPAPRPRRRRPIQASCNRPKDLTVLPALEEALRRRGDLPRKAENPVN